MATDKLIFPIGFDLEKAVADAEGQADKLLRRLETTIRSRPLAVNLKITNAGSGSINEINARLKEIVKEWNNLTEAERIGSKTSGEYTDRAKKLIAEFTRLTGATESYARGLQQIAAAARKAANEQERNLEKQRKTEAILKAQENTIANITAKLQHYKKEMNSAEMGSKQFRKAAEEVKRLSHNLTEAQRRVNALTDNFKNQDGYVSRLVKRLAVYAGYQQFTNFITSVREVTAEFELQRISLGAIIQDQAKANQLFSEIKQFALKSPVKILDLTKYTKQLAAYKFETKELFDWTKRLTDISVGLGVSMDRIILLAGQIRATGYLRGCLGYGTKVEMWSGSKKEVQDVSVGDVLMGDDETPRVVKKLYRGVQQMYNVDCGGAKFRCNEHHILTLYNTTSNKIEDVYVFDYLKSANRYKGVKRRNGKYEYCDIHLAKDTVDNYYGFEIDGNKRFIVEDNIVTHNSEVRQATEAGIPLVEELAKKLEELNGRAYTTAEVMNLISERAISWEMVADVFKDMTSAGGMFFDIQEKQGNTLYGMWQKLGDAASVMYEEIGNTDSVNAGMKNLISTLRTLMLNWKQTGAALATVGVAVLLFINRVRLAEKMVELSIIAESKSVLALKSKQAALTRLIAIQRALTGAVKADTVATKAWTLAKIRGYQALNLFTAAVKGLWAALTKNIWGIAILGLSLLAEKLWLAEDAAEKLRNKLSDIKLDYEVKQGQDASNFEYLANAAVEAAKGSKAQKDALEELKNTYGKIIPLELLTIENLERMKGNYGELIALIDEYNLKQKHEAETSAIEESFAPEQEKRVGIIREKLREGLRLDYADEETGGVFDKVLDLSERNIQRFLLNLNKYAEEGKTKGEQIIVASKDLAKELGLNEGETQALIDAMWNLDRGELEGQGTLMDYTEGLQRKHEALSVVNEDYDKAKKKLNEFSSIVDDVMKKNEDEPEVTTYNNVIENEKARLNKQVGDVANGIIELFKTANVEVDNGTKQLLQTVVTNGGMIPTTVWDLLEKTAENINNPKLLAEIQRLRQHYQKLAPDNETVNFVRSGFIKIVNAAKGNMQEYRQYLYDGSVSIKEYQDNLNKSITSLKAQAYEMIRVNALIDAGLVKGQKYDEATINALQNRADNLQAILDQYVTPLIMPDDKKSKSGGTKSDDRLSKLQEILSTLEKINTKYEELRKKEGDTKALEDIQKMYANTLAYANKIAQSKPFAKFGLQFKMPTQFSTLQEYRKAILDIINTLKMKGFEKAALDLEEKIGTGDIDKLQKDIEKKLKSLADRISRTKTAKEFYEKILGMTGDINLASKVRMSIYGDNGDLKALLAKQVRELTNGIELPEGIIKTDNLIDYKALREFAEANRDELGKTYDELVKIAEDGQKDLAKTYEDYLKDLEKAKNYSDKRIELARTTADKIISIEADIAANRIDSNVGNDIISGLRKREDKETAKLEYEAFKDTPMYVQMFADLDNASTTMLRNMKSMLTKLKGKWGEALEPTQLKEMQSRLNEISEQLAKRNPFKAIGDGIGKIRALNKQYGSLKNVETELSAAPKGLLDNKEALTAALQAETAAREAYNKAVAESGADSAEAQKAKTDWSAATTLVTSLRKSVNLSEQEVKLLQEIIDKFKEANDEIDDGFNGIGEYVAKVKEAQDAIKGAVEEWSALGDDELWNAIFDGLDKMAQSAEQGGEAVAAYFQGDYFTMVTKGISSVANLVSGIGKIFWGSKVAKANKEIKRQQQLLEQLEYTYKRLQNATDKLFGADYISNYNQQIKVLEAQQAAYLKQAEAERSKGKKADKDKIKEYEDAARDTADAIKDMEADLTAHFTETSRSDAAREFAQSWIEAKSTLANTFDAIKSDYTDMLRNMIIEGAAAKVIDAALAPLWKNMDEMLANNDITGAIDYMIEGMDGFLSAADNGMEVLWKSLEAKGYDMKKLLGDSGTNLTGISRDFATASEESINGLAAHMNTLEYYVAQIHQNVATMAGGGVASTATWTDYTPLIQQSLENQAMMVRNTAETVAECRNIAAKCQAQTDLISKVIVPRNQTGAYKVYVGM